MTLREVMLVTSPFEMYTDADRCNGEARHIQTLPLWNKLRRPPKIGKKYLRHLIASCDLTDVLNNNRRSGSKGVVKDGGIA